HASRPTQRGVGHRHNEGRGAVDAEVPLTNGAEAYGKDVGSWRRGAGVNAPRGNSLSGRYGGKRAVLRGEHVISRKAIAQGMDAGKKPIQINAIRSLCSNLCRDPLTFQIAVYNLISDARPSHSVAAN